MLIDCVFYIGDDGEPVLTFVYLTDAFRDGERQNVAYGTIDDVNRYAFNRIRLCPWWVRGAKEAAAELAEKF